jgi:hypothetical protein
MPATRGFDQPPVRDGPAVRVMGEFSMVIGAGHQQYGEFHHDSLRSHTRPAANIEHNIVLRQFIRIGTLPANPFTSAKHTSVGHRIRGTRLCQPTIRNHDSRATTLSNARNGACKIHRADVARKNLRISGPRASITATTICNNVTKLTAY